MKTGLQYQRGHPARRQDTYSLQGLSKRQGQSQDIRPALLQHIQSRDQRLKPELKWGSWALGRGGGVCGGVSPSTGEAGQGD